MGGSEAAAADEATGGRGGRRLCGRGHSERLQGMLLRALPVATPQRLQGMGSKISLKGAFTPDAPNDFAHARNDLPTSAFPIKGAALCPSIFFTQCPSITLVA